MHRHLVTVLALAALVGCASDRYVYAPVRTTSVEVGGEPAVVYAIPPDAPRGDLRLGTFGITSLQPLGSDEPTVTAVHVAFVVSNQSAETWTIDGSEQQLALTGRDKRLVDGAMTNRMARLPRIEIAANTSRWVDLFFPLPQGYQKARDVSAFDVIWTVRTASRVFTERTAFARSVIEAPRTSAPDLKAPDDFPGNDDSAFPAAPPGHPRPFPLP